jgi:hypothetical protein
MDREIIRRALLDLRVAVDDADAVTRDMLRSPRERELGPVLHRDNYSEARAKIAAGFAFLLTCVEPESTDPAGSGGAGSAY